MPSTVTFPLWVCFTPTLSWKCLDKQEGNQSRASSGEAAVVPRFCSYMVPPSALLTPTLRGPLPQLVKNGESNLQDSVQKPGVHQETPWPGELGMTSSDPSYDFSSLAPNFFVKKGPWTEKPLWGIPSSVARSSISSWGEQDHPFYLADLYGRAGLALIAVPKAPRFPGNSQERHRTAPTPL